MYEDYLKRANTSIENHISILPPRYLIPLGDYEALRKLKLCDKIKDALKQDFNRSELPKSGGFIYNPTMDKEQILREAEICRTMNNINLTKPLPPESLTTHHWVHSWDPAFNEVWANKTKVHIQTLVPHVKFYTNLLIGRDTSAFYSTEPLV
jgi:hypothetical protein